MLLLDVGDGVDACDLVDRVLLVDRGVDLQLFLVRRERDKEEEEEWREKKRSEYMRKTFFSSLEKPKMKKG